MQKIYSKILILAVLTGIFSCAPDDKFEDVPYLEWDEAEFIEEEDTTSNRWYVKVSLYFTDGDGDVGFEQNVQDTGACDTNNYDLFLRYFEQVDGTFVEQFPDDPCQPFHNALPYLTPEGQNKTLEGYIKSPFDYSGFPKNNTDSIKFEVYITDRAGHSSNVVSSPSIFVPEL